ncbi:MAG: hypothetical protein ACRDEA_17350 [Microcystaceae cyanobacterium]
MLPVVDARAVHDTSKKHIDSQRSVTLRVRSRYNGGNPRNALLTAIATTGLEERISLSEVGLMH